MIASYSASVAAVSLAALVVWHHPVHADQLVVNVLDENNKGVVSIVRINDGSAWKRIAETDQKGVLSRSYTCKAGNVLRAEPEDIGRYFMSNTADCGRKVVLHVVSRRVGDKEFATSTYEEFLVSTATGEKTFAVVTRAAVKADVKTETNAGLMVCSGSINLETSGEVYEVTSEGKLKRVGDQELARK